MSHIFVSPFQHNKERYIRSVYSIHIGNSARLKVLIDVVAGTSDVDKHL